MTDSKSKPVSEEQAASQSLLQCSPSQIADRLVNKLVDRNSDSMFTDNFTFSIGTIFKLVLLLSLGEIKELARWLLTSVVPLLKRSPFYALMLFTRVKGSMLRTKPQLQIEQARTNHKLTIDANDQFVLALYCYINNNPDCQFERCTSKIGINNLKDRFMTETISGITVGLITILDRIDYNISMLTGEPVGMNIQRASVRPTKPVGIKSYIELFDEKQQKVLQKAITNYKNGLTVSEFVANCKASSYTELDIAKRVVRKYPSLDLGETCYGIGSLLALYHYGGHSDRLDNIMPSLTERMKNGQKCYFDPHHVHTFCSSKPILFVMNTCISFHKAKISASEIQEAFGYLFKNHAFGPGLAAKATLTTGPRVRKLTLEVPYDEPAINVTNLARAFVDDVCKYQRCNAVNTSIKIYCLLLETLVTKTEEPNPEYEHWAEQKKVLDEYKSLTKKAKKDSEQEADLNAPVLPGPSVLRVPPKKLITEAVTKTIVNKLLNEVSKSIDTLYLREADMAKLLTSLDQFRNKKEILKSLGLPNKLNVLLYGEPGTGKSTAIQAIATYLGRNIYYLDLKNAVTNQDLQMMFEYVNKNVQNGGIIVIEDIDAMTDIVLKRESVAELRVNQLVSSTDAKLSLEYLLNILQGTLTLDDSIFVVTTNHIDHLDPAFYRDGRFDVKIELKLSDHYQIQSIYQKFLNRKIPEPLLARIPEGVFSPATIIFHVKDYLFASDVTDEAIVARFINQD